MTKQPEAPPKTPSFRRGATLVIERSELAEDGSWVPPSFEATFARDNVVDSDGVLCGGSAFQHVTGEALPLIRAHGKDPAAGQTTLGAGYIAVENGQAKLRGRLHNTEAAREFEREAASLAEFGLGECSIGGTALEGHYRAANAAEAALGATVTVERANAHELSWAVKGKMPNSTFELKRAVEFYATQPAEMSKEDKAILERAEALMGEKETS